MAVPKQKTSRSRRNQRRNHIRIIPKQLVMCKNCAAMHVAHHICQNCGFYGERQIIKIARDIQADRFGPQKK